MENYPNNLVEFEQQFSSEEACRRYLASARWPEGFICPRCGVHRSWNIVPQELQECAGCGAQISVTAGTIFQDTKKPLRLWFRAMWHITSQKYGANALGLQRTLGLGSYRTAWAWLQKLRRAMVRPGRDRLSGTIQVDETYVGGKKAGKRGRGAEGKMLVLIMVEENMKEKKMGRIRLAYIPDASATSLHHSIRNAIESGSTIVTDSWTGYKGLSSLGYEHIEAYETATIEEDVVPLPHIVAGLLKRWILGIYQGSMRPTYFAYYLDEYTFRFNRRTSASRGKLFYRLVQQAAQIDPVPFSPGVYRKNEQ